jgi:hypothetical protein
MALQLKYEIRQFHIDAQGPAVMIHVNVLVTTYDDNGNVVKQQSADLPEYTWSQLPQAIKDDILALRDDVLAALKTKYGTGGGDDDRAADLT